MNGFLKTVIGLGKELRGNIVCNQISVSLTLLVKALQRQALDLSLIAGIV